MAEQNEQAGLTIRTVNGYVQLGEGARAEVLDDGVLRVIEPSANGDSTNTLYSPAFWQTAGWVDKYWS